MKKQKLNKRVVVYSLIALICLALVYVVSWYFIVPAVILMILNQRKIFRNRK